MNKKVFDDKKIVLTKLPSHLENYVSLCTECKMQMDYFDTIEKRTTVWFCNNSKCRKHRIFVF